MPCDLILSVHEGALPHFMDFFFLMEASEGKTMPLVT